MTSSSSNRVRLLPAGLAIGLLASAVVGLQVLREQRFGTFEPAQDVLYVQSPAVMTRLALSFDAVVADIYWIRAIQYYGSRRLSKEPVKHYDLLYPLLNLTTSLDPSFMIAYRFGALFLSEQPPGGAGQPDKAMALLEKAMRANPDRWEYPHDVGFLYYRAGDYRAAAEWFRRAAEVPGATNWLEPLAAVTLARGGEREASRLLWQQLYASADAEWIRRTAEHRLNQLDALDQIATLERITAEYERRHGDPPRTWHDVIREGLIPGIPHDPAGFQYQLNPWWGLVTLSDDSPLGPLPSEGY